MENVCKAMPFCRRYLFWILTSQKTTSSAYKIEQKSEDILLIMLLAQTLQIRCVLSVMVLVFHSFFLC